jgi:adenylate kinase family enzyme
MKDRIHIFGASGSGTTTLAKAICAKTGFAHLDSDSYLWAPTDPPFTTKRTPEERLALLRRDIDLTEHVVLSGSMVGWGDPLIPEFTLAVRLLTPSDVRMARLEKREYERFGSRIGPGGDMHEQHLAFLQWAAAYDTAGPEQRSIQQHDLWQKKLNCTLLVLNGSDPIDKLTETVLRNITM